MKRLILLALFVLQSALVMVCAAQNQFVDSLKNVLSTTVAPAGRFDILNKIQTDWWVSGAGMIDSARVVEMLNLALEMDNDSLQAISYIWIGEHYQWTEDDYAKALESYLKAVPLAEKSGSTSWLSFVYSDISFLFWNLHNTIQQKKYVQNAVASLPGRQHPMYNYVLQKAYLSSGTYFNDIGKPDSALHAFQALIELNLKTKSPFYESAATNGLSIVYAQLGDTSLSDTYTQKAIKICQQSGDIFDAVRYEIYYANSLLQQNRLDEAKQIAIHGFAISKQNDYKKPILDLAKILKIVYTKEQQTDSAFCYAQIESDMKDALLNAQKINSIHDMAFAEQLRNIEERAKQEKEEQERNENIQYALIALGIITLIILFLMLSRSFLTSERVIEFLGVFALLLVFEFLNLVLHPFLARVTHHTPLLMLLGLVCIAAVLVPLHHRLEKWATVKLVEKNKQTRLAAAKKTVAQLEQDKKE